MFSYNFKRNALKHIIFCGLLLNTSFLTTTTSFAAPSIEAGIQSANDELVAYGSSKVYDVNYSLYKDGRLVIEGAGGFNRYLGPLNGFIKDEYLDQAKSLIIKNIRWIKSETFKNCKNVTTVTFDQSGSLDVESIGDYAFEGCSSLKTIIIPKYVSEMGSKVFQDCTNLESIRISASVSKIGSRMFAGCPNLKSIVVEEGNEKYDSRENCNAIVETATNTLVCGTENSIIPSTITAIGNETFAETGLKNIVIPEGVTSIELQAFENCQDLESVTLPQSLKKLGYHVFANSGLTSLVIPEGITHLPQGTFNGCKNLETVTLPTTLETIEYNAFSNSGLTSIFIPKGVTNISSSAFNNCEKLSTISVSDENTTYDSRNNCNAIIQTATNQIVKGTFNTIIPNTITSIGNDAFSGINSLTSIVIPESVTSIGQFAFYHCYSLASIVIPESVTSINYCAFWNCNSPAEVVCKAKVAPQLYRDVFSNDILSKATLYVPEESVESYKADGEWKKFSDIQPLPYAYINISAAEKTTYCSEHALDFTNIEGAKAYIASGFSPSTGVVLLTKVNKVPAGVGFMVIGKEGKYEVPYCETDFTYANLLVGTMSQTTVASTADGKTNYVLSNGSEGVMFYLANNATVPAKKAYLSIPSTIVNEAQVKAVRLAFEDDMTTNIIRVEDMTKKTTDKVYGLDGRCKKGLSSGINIVNGKKIYVK